MIRFSEMVLPGHPDKFCDQAADAIVAACAARDPEAYCQVEVGAWCDRVWLSGSIALGAGARFPLADLVHATARDIGLRFGTGGAGRALEVDDGVCWMDPDPRIWTRKVNDQSICSGWAGGDARTAFLPPEHLLAHRLRQALWEAIREGSLQGEGPDGKLLVQVAEEGASWRLEQVLVTLQQREETPFLDLCGNVQGVLRAAYAALSGEDPRWTAPWQEVALVVNPNGPLVQGGPWGDNGQTGRKLAMDFYGPRVGLGGGALSGKHLTHIDRIGSYAAREAAVRAVATGARECRVQVAYAPNLAEPLEVVYDMEGRGERMSRAFFHHGAMQERYGAFRIVPRMGQGIHFLEPAFPWNHG